MPFYSLTRMHRFGLYCLRVNRIGAKPSALITDDFGNLVFVARAQFNASAYGSL